MKNFLQEILFPILVLAASWLIDAAIAYFFWQTIITSYFAMAPALTYGQMFGIRAFVGFLFPGVNSNRED